MPSRLLLFAALALALAAPAAAQPADAVRAAQALPPGYAYPGGDTVRVATFNLENWVDGHDNPYNPAAQESRPDTAALAARTRLLAPVLRALAADVVAFQEVEGEAVVRALLGAVVPEMGYRFVAAADDGDWHQNVVVASRLPLGPLTSFADAVTPLPGQTTPDGRPEASDQTNHRLLAVDVYARPGWTLTLVAAHLKAGPSARDEAWRLGQAALVHAWLGQRVGRQAGEAAVVLAGDLNTVPGAASFAALLNADGARGPVRFADPLAGRPLALTHPSAAPTRRLDHVLLSPAAARRMAGAARVVRKLAPADQEALSDHLPVVVTLVAPPARRSVR